MSITWQKSASVMYMGIPPFGGREQSYDDSPKEFRSRFMEDDPSAYGRANLVSPAGSVGRWATSHRGVAARFLADSHVVSHATSS